MSFGLVYVSLREKKKENTNSEMFFSGILSLQEN